MPKIWRTLNYVAGIRWENCTELFYVMCLHRGIKISASNFESLPPKNLEQKNVVINFATIHRLHWRQQTVRCLLGDYNYRSFGDVCSILPFPKDAEELKKCNILKQRQINIVPPTH